MLNQTKTKTMEKEKYIAFRTVDMEGDAWCEKAFLFSSEEDVNNFFNKNNPDLINHFSDETSKKSLDRFFVYNENPAKIINSVSFECDYAGEVIIRRIHSGYVLTPKP